MSIYRKSSVSRTFHWLFEEFNINNLDNYVAHGRYYTDDFTIILNGTKTKWRFAMQFNKNSIKLFLQKITASSNDFNVSLIIDTIGDVICHSCLKFLLCNEIYAKPASEISAELGLELLIQDFDYGLLMVRNPETIGFRIKITLSRNTQYMAINPLYEFLHNSETLSDFTFECSDGLTIPAHRDVLALGSPVMKVMLEAPMHENFANRASLDDIDGETMMEVLRYLYRGYAYNIEKLYPKLLYAADKYDIEGLKNACASTVVETLTVENVIEHLQLAEQFNAVKLLTFCIHLIKRHYYELCHQVKKLSPNLMAAIIESAIEDAKYVTVFNTDINKLTSN